MLANKFLTIERAHILMLSPDGKTSSIKQGFQFLASCHEMMSRSLHHVAHCGCSPVSQQVLLIRELH